MIFVYLITITSVLSWGEEVGRSMSVNFDLSTLFHGDVCPGKELQNRI